MNETKFFLVSQKDLRFFLFLVGALALLLWAWLSGWPSAILAVDVKQERINQALPKPSPSITIRQDFYARHNGLREIELQFARYDPDDKGGELFFKLFDDQGQLLREEMVETQKITHNQIWVLRFYRQDQSAGRRYTLQVTGNELTPFSLWGYTLDTLDGDLTVTAASTEARDLRLITRYQLTLSTAISELLKALRRDGALFGLALAFILMPGCLALLLTELVSPASLADSPPERDVAAWWGVALALGLSIWALLWFWMTQIGLRWTSSVLWFVLGLGWSAVIALWMVKRSRPRPSSKEPPRPIASYLLLLLILFGGLAVRLLAVRDLSFPLWVDSIRHALITTLMATKGQVLYDYAPLLPMIDRFPYHFGYHTLPASLLMMTGWPLPRMLLSLGQLLNALMPLVIYSAAWLLTKRRDAGLLAACFVAFPFLLPGYYATWGRFTQLTGMLIMSILVGLTWQITLSPSRATSPSGKWWLVGLLAAGLFLVHLRVFIYWLPFPALLGITLLFLRPLPSSSSATAPPSPLGLSLTRKSPLALLAASALLGGLLIAPRVPYLLQGTSVTGLTRGIEGYNEFPIGYVTTGWEKYFIWLAGASLMGVIIAWLRKKAWAKLPLLLGLWVASLFILLGGKYLGLPESWLVNLNSMYITLFLPLSLLLGITLTRYWWQQEAFFERLEKAKLSRLLYLPLGALLTATLLFGIHHQITILNPQTILAYEDDLTALEWVKANTPPDARFAINSWLWLARTWSGSDGGAWLFLFTQRDSSTPPADYAYNRSLNQEIYDFNEKLSRIEDWTDPSAVEFLREHGITHLFIGVKGGFLDPAALARNPALVMRYQQNGTFVFEVME